MNIPHDFDKKLEEGGTWVPLLVEKIEDFIIKYNIRTISYKTHKDIEIQRNGIDIIIESESSGWEAKIRGPEAIRYYDKDILLETMSVKEKNILGWLYTSKADVIVYCWQNTFSTNLMPRGYFILLKKLRQTAWFKTLTNKYRIQPTISKRETPTGTIYWTTEFITPPIKDFPKGTLVRFNPSTSAHYTQQPIFNFLEASIYG